MSITKRCTKQKKKKHTKNADHSCLSLPSADLQVTLGARRKKCHRMCVWGFEGGRRLRTSYQRQRCAPAFPFKERDASIFNKVLSSLLC